jgi:hypothetical protein
MPPTDRRNPSVSRLFGGQGDRWSLARAVDALGDSARLAGVPGWIWLAGLVYPALALNPGFGLEGSLNEEDWAVRLAGTTWLGTPFALAPLVLPFLARLWAGLARTSAPGVWAESARGRKPPGLRTVWRAGRGLTLSALGLWLQLALLAILATAVLVMLPAALLGSLVQSSPDFLPAAVLLAPLMLWVAAFLLVLSLLFQLSLHSLAQNRRGVASALLHAWRIARNDPWATLRTVLVDLILSLTVLLLSVLVSGALAATCVGLPLIFLLLAALAGFTGVTRACYWARAYRALGGLSPEDRVPGLRAAAAEGVAGSGARGW